jgi:hypothetical protein
MAKMHEQMMHGSGAMCSSEGAAPARTETARPRG